MVKEWKFCCIPFRFVLWSQNNLILHIQCSHRLSRGKEKNKICCFLTSYTHQAEFFLLIFLILWSFMHWTLNKRCLETWSCVSGYCTCGLFLCFRSLWNIRNFQKNGAGLFESRLLNVTRVKRYLINCFFLVWKCFSPLTFSSVVWVYYRLSI